MVAQHTQIHAYTKIKGHAKEYNFPLKIERSTFDNEKINLSNYHF